MKTLADVQSMYDDIMEQVFTIHGTDNHLEVTHKIIQLSEAVHGNDDEFIWDLGEFSECTLGDFIVGAYWHYTEWHSGQNSIEYEALCRLGEIFSPGMSSVESENAAYQQLGVMAACTSQKQ